MWQGRRVIIVRMRHSVERINNMKPTKEQFKDYVRIQKSGVTNMWAIAYVCALSHSGLTKDICFYIMEHYEELMNEYGS